MCTTCIPVDRRGQKRKSNFLALEFQVVNHQVGPNKCFRLLIHFSKPKDSLIFMGMIISLRVNICTIFMFGTQRAQMRDQIWFWATMDVLETEPGSFTRAVSVLKCWDISLAPSCKYRTIPCLCLTSLLQHIYEINLQAEHFFCPYSFI